MSLRKILFQKPGNLKELITELKKETSNKRQVTIYKDFLEGKIVLYAIINSKRIPLVVYRFSYNSPHSKQEEIDIRAKEYESRLKQEGFQVEFYW